MFSGASTHRALTLGVLFSALLGPGGCTTAVRDAQGHNAPAHPAQSAAPPPAPSSPVSKRRVIVFVWDGLRPDSIDPRVTPRLARLRDELGVNFRNHHSVYPTFTMMNAAAFATGARSAVHGFYGNYQWLPGPSGLSAKGTEVDYAQPVFTEDHRILQTLDAHARQRDGSALLRVETLFEVAHAAGLKTAAIGKSGPVFMQDYRQDGETGVVLDENVVLPRSFGLALQAAGLPLPKHSAHHPYPDGALELAADNGDPTATSEPALITLADGVTADPRAAAGSPHNAKNAYLMRVFLEYVLPELDPTLSMIWLRNPDSTQHSYGPGTPNAIDALRHQDMLLGQLLTTLDTLGRTQATDLLIASDHGHSTVGSDANVFAPRALSGAADGRATVGEVATPGYVVSGDVRTADLLRRAGFAAVYDGAGCVFDPVLAGIGPDAKPVYAERTDATCEKGPRHLTGSFRVPKGALPKDAIVIAANGGSEYFYVPSQSPKLVQRLVTALQERKQYGPLFVRERHGAISGTLPLAYIGMEGRESASPPTPDVVMSFDWDDSAISAVGPHAPGTEHASAQGFRGMHGSFSPIDVRNTLIAAGPAFRAGFVDDHPSSTLDVAPTIAAILGLALPKAEGRTLDEALVAGTASHTVTPFEEHVGPVPLRRVCEVNDPACKRPGPAAAYRLVLSGQALSTGEGGRRYVYFDQAKVSRVPTR